MAFDNNQRRRALLVKNTIFAAVAYAITQAATLIAKLFEFSSVSYSDILFITSSSLGSCLVFLVVVKLKKTMSMKFAHFVYFGQFVIWLVLYTLWILSLRETRVMALFCALMALTFLLSNTGLIQSIAITTLTTILQIGGSYYAIFHLHQPGSFALEVYYTACFIPSALFICHLSGQYARQRSEIKEAKLAAERNRDALVVEMGKVNTINDELEKAMARIAELAIRDELTGLYNRRHLMDSLEMEKKRADRTGQVFSLLMFDVDHFKRINDTYGHLKGDIVLKAVAKAVQQTLRETDYCARYGGEEFLVVLQKVDPPGARVCVERLRSLIESLKFPEIGGATVITISLGYTQYRPIETVAQAIARVDAALYRAKNAGRNRAEFD
ncbi:MAG: GGDEF domain-containing protein [Rhodoferax sp.]|jgi:diguanylate cyclase (GGDEF)-like protein|nr:GGDEF domain-containing protein [Rhodoferax sp.]MBP9061633.1 GGDEF domain-containing protein [Rhodoferax sp.]MBP9683249.1 GGDEF domain-containing protein [Rhodoferax sp.]